MCETSWLVAITMSAGNDLPGLTRRAAIAAGAAATAFLTGHAQAQSRQADPVLQTDYGPVRGRTADGLQMFLGVRYGADTARTRFARPLPPDRWTDTISATAFGHASPQPGLEPDQSEDCLFLNVWTPGAGDGAARPIMVYVHGGGYATGSGASPLTDGAILAARHDVVVVTLNHRLNVFGYLYLEQLAAGFRPDGGNAGQWDLVLALQWIRAHARRLGGDRDRVMLFGQSGGGAKIATLMATPAAAGLFGAVATMSGQQVTASGPLNATRRAGALIDRLGISATSPADLLAVPASRLVEALAADDPVNPQMRVYFGPVLDQRMLPRHPFWPDAPPQSRHIPMVLGNVLNETRNLIGRSEPAAFSLDWDQLPGWLARHMRTDIDPRHVIATYQAAYPQITAPDLFFAATTAARSWRGQVEEADMRARQNAPTWVYRLDLPAVGDNSRYGAFHTLDIPHAFGTLASVESATGTGPDALQVSSALMGALAALARTGSPEHPAIPDWPQYRLDDRHTLLLDRTITIARDPRAVERELFATVPFIQWGS